MTRPPSPRPQGRPRLVIPSDQIALLLNLRRVNRHSIMILSKIMGYSETIIRRHLMEHNLHRTVQAYEKVWPAKDVAKVKALTLAGHGPLAISEITGRTAHAISGKLKRLRKQDVAYAQQLSRSRSVPATLPTSKGESVHV